MAEGFDGVQARLTVDAVVVLQRPEQARRMEHGVACQLLLDEAGVIGEAFTPAW